MDIQVGDRVLYKTLRDDKNYAMIIENDYDIRKLIERISTEMKYDQIKILKVERPNYEAIEEKKDLLTEEEREFLKQFVKFNEFSINRIRKTSTRIYFYNNMNLVETMEKNENCFKNLETGRYYFLSELGLN